MADIIEAKPITWADGVSGGTPISAQSLNDNSDYIIDQINNRILKGGNPGVEAQLIVKEAENAETANFATNAGHASTAGSASVATNAGNVTSSINGISVTQIFEADKTTVKEATNAQSAVNADNAQSAVEAEKGVYNIDGSFERLSKSSSSDEAVLSLGGNKISQKRNVWSGSASNSLSSDSYQLLVQIPSLNLEIGKKYTIEGTFSTGTMITDQFFTLDFHYDPVTYNSSGFILKALLPILRTSSHPTAAIGTNTILSVLNNGADLQVRANSQEVVGDSDPANYKTGTTLTILKIDKIII